jgi:hypothetical protein
MESAAMAAHPAPLRGAVLHGIKLLLACGAVTEPRSAARERHVTS